MSSRLTLTLALIPLIIVLFSLFGPLRTDAVWHYSGLVIDGEPSIMDGEPSIEPNMGVTAQALGRRAAEEVMHGRWPLWNHFEGLGAPLLGEMQSAALFPPTWLIALPRGQTIEQALLQGLAGLGCFLFFRRFGLETRGALAGALVFEVNGIFAWLRNAIFNPVAALPWLFLVIEILFAAAVIGAPWRRRVVTISLGATVAALAVYAGFPEEVYFYGLMLMAWVVFRMARLGARQNLRLLGDLMLTGILAVLMSAPVLVAFADFLSQADLGSHSQGGFSTMWLEPAATLQYIAPYVYGRIFSSSVPVLNSITGGTGGYIGFIPVIYALGTLRFRTRRSTKLFLLGWIVLAVSVSEGVPIFHDAFMLIPLAKAAAVFRYLNASWIFAFVFLSAMFVDDVADCPAELLVRTLLTASILGLGVLALAIICSWSVVSDLVASGGRERRSVLAAIAAAVTLAILTSGMVLGRNPRRTASFLAVLAVSEALVWFAYPYLSSPRGGRLDTDLIAFLRGHVGFGRVVNTTEGGIGVNYGSYFGIALLNYDDLPVPEATAAYVRSHFDPYSASTSFAPEAEAATGEQRQEEKKLFRARLPVYGRAGVSHVLAGPDFGTVDPYGPHSGAGNDLLLVVGQTVRVGGPIGVDLARPSSTLILTLRAEGATASGHLSVKACVGGNCASSVGDVSKVDERQGLMVNLDHALSVTSGQTLTIEVTRSDGNGQVTLAGLKHPGGGSGDAEASLPQIRFRDDALHLAYVGRSMSVYALDGARSYASAEACDVHPSTRDSIDLICAAPSRLVRLELAMRGWEAEVNGKPVPIGTEDDAFQVIDLPAGASHVEFHYEPRLFWPSVWAACMAFAIGLWAVLRGGLKARAFDPRS